jgi:hypothetical protein
MDERWKSFPAPCPARLNTDAILYEAKSRALVEELMTRATHEESPF